MTSLRASEGSLVMHEAVVFGQQFSYHSTHPLDTMLQPGYWLGLIRRFQVGDEVLLLTFRQNGESKRVAAMTRCIVVEISSDAGLELMPYVGPIAVPETKALPPEAPPERLLVYAGPDWSVRHTPRSGWRVLDGEGKVLIRRLDQVTARAVVVGNVALCLDDENNYFVVDPENFLGTDQPAGDTPEAA